MSAAEMLDDALDETPEFCFCGQMLDPGQLWCGLDFICRNQAQMEYGERFDSPHPDRHGEDGER